MIQPLNYIPRCRLCDSYMKFIILRLMSEDWFVGEFTLSTLLVSFHAFEEKLIRNRLTGSLCPETS